MLAAVARRYGHEFTFDEALIGGIAIDETGNPLPEATVAACRASAAVLLGAVGGPKWSDPGAAVRPEQGLLGLRKALELFANLRPVKVVPALAGASPLRPDLVQGVDLLVVRELTGGLSLGRPQGVEQTPAGQVAVDTLRYSEAEIERLLAWLSSWRAAGASGWPPLTRLTCWPRRACGGPWHIAWPTTTPT